MLLHRKLSIKSSGFFLLVIIFAASITSWYVSSEHGFYFWDHAFYMNMAIDTSKMFMQTPFQALKVIYLSTGLEYNYYFVLPLIPFLELFKYSRLGYILGLVFVYHIPTLIASGYIARKVFPSVPFAGWITIFTGISIPALWASVFRGFPDTGAVFLIVLAIVVYLQDMELKRWQFQLPAIGTLSGLAVIFRRHFAYSVAVFLFSIGAFLIIYSIHRSGKSWRKFILECWNAFIKMQIILTFLVLILFLLAPSLLLKIMYTNYLNLYESYSSYPYQVFIYFFRAYGVLWLLAGFGYVAAIIKARDYFRLDDGNVSQSSLYFILLFGVTSYVVWALIPRQIDVHYVLHVAILIIVGVSTFVVLMVVNANTKIHWLTIFVFSFLFVYNLWAGLAPASSARISTTLNYPPLYRPDYDEVVRLVAYLRKATGGVGKVYVVDSSKVMNNEIVHFAEVSQYGDNLILQILHSPQVDSRDFYPLDSLLQADYIIVTTPFQSHLREDEQKVVEFTFDAFTKQWKISKDFKKLPEKFRLLDGAILSVYKRQSPTTIETTLLTFDQMRKYIGRLPGGQSDWVLITQSTGMDWTHGNDGRKHSVVMTNDSSLLSFLYAGADRAQVVITGKVGFLAENCPPVEISADVFPLSEPVSLLYEKQMIAGAGVFALNFSKADDTALILSFRKSANPSGSLCNPVIEWEMTE